LLHRSRANAIQAVLQVTPQPEAQLYVEPNLASPGIEAPINAG
jgi:hypothetical protein